MLLINVIQKLLVEHCDVSYWQCLILPRLRDHYTYSCSVVLFLIFCNCRQTFVCVCDCVFVYIYICCCVRIVSYYQHGLCIKWIHSSASELSDSKPKRKQQIRVCFWQSLQPRKLSRPGLWGDLPTCTGIILRIISNKREGGAFDTLQWSLNLWNKPFVSIWCLKRVIQGTYTFTYGW